jgi:hypothetical protein
MGCGPPPTSSPAWAMYLRKRLNGTSESKPKWGDQRADYHIAAEAPPTNQGQAGGLPGASRACDGVCQQPGCGRSPEEAHQHDCEALLPRQDPVGRHQPSLARRGRASQGREVPSALAGLQQPELSSRASRRLLDGRLSDSRRPCPRAAAGD